MARVADPFGSRRSLRACWPGVHCAQALLEGKPPQGVWYDGTALHEARERGEKASLADFAGVQTLHLTPLPCWQGLPVDEIRARIQALIHLTERKNDERRRATGKIGRTGEVLPAPELEDALPKPPKSRNRHPRAK